MNTLDENVRELVHGEIDGTNTSSDTELLRHRLADDKNLRAYYDQMQAVSNTLSSLSDEDPPPALRTSILASIPAAETRASGTERWFQGPRGALKLGYAFAAGVLVATAILLWARPLPPGAVDVKQLAGTMGGPATVSGSAVIATERLALADIDGEVALRSRQGGITVELDLRSPGPVEIVATASDPSLRWQGVTAGDGSLVPVTADHRHIALVNEGKNRLTLLAAGQSAGDTQIFLEFRKGTRVVHEMRMALGAAQ